MNKFYKKAEKFVVDAFIKARSKIVKHHPRTVYWVKKLKPEADEALLIAAVAHDIDRAFPKSKKAGDVLIKRNSFLDKKYLRGHQKRSAEIIDKFLKKMGAGKQLLKRVKILVSKHEEGGTEDQNVLKDADSISFFENNVDFFLTDKIKEMGKEEVKEKLNWMYSRITSKEAKEIAKPYYLKAVKKLKNKD